MNVNYNFQAFKNNFTPNRKDNRMPTLPLFDSEPRTNNIFLNIKNNGRNNNIISLHKTPKNNNNFFLKKFNTNNNKIYERNKLLISTDIKQNDNNKISFSSFETKLNYKVSNSYNNTLNNINKNSQSENFFHNHKNNVMLTDSNEKKNIINQKMRFNSKFIPVKDSYQQMPKNDNNLTEVKKRRFSVMEMGKNNFDFRINLTNSNNKNISNQRRKSIFNPRNSNTSSTFKTINNAPRRYSISFVTNPDLRERITELLKEMSLHHKKEIEKYEKGEDNTFNGKKVKKKNLKINQLILWLKKIEINF